jgi:insertion element IS1 protein InsB
VKTPKPFPPLEQTLAEAAPEEVLELDELWSFVGHKGWVRWLWIALCRRTRQVVAYVFGDRSEATCRRLWNQIPQAYRRSLCYTDFWHSYQKVIPPRSAARRGRRLGRPTTWSGGTARYGSGSAASYGSRSPRAKCDRMHEACLRLYLHPYNRERRSAYTINLQRTTTKKPGTSKEGRASSLAI